MANVNIYTSADVLTSLLPGQHRSWLRVQDLDSGPWITIWSPSLGLFVCISPHWCCWGLFQNSWKHQHTEHFGQNEDLTSSGDVQEQQNEHDGVMKQW